MISLRDSVLQRKHSTEEVERTKAALQLNRNTPSTVQWIGRRFSQVPPPGIMQIKPKKYGQLVRYRDYKNNHALHAAMYISARLGEHAFQALWSDSPMVFVYYILQNIVHSIGRLQYDPIAKKERFMFAGLPLSGAESDYAHSVVAFRLHKMNPTSWHMQVIVRILESLQAGDRLYVDSPNFPWLLLAFSAYMQQDAVFVDDDFVKIDFGAFQTNEAVASFLRNLCKTVVDLWRISRPENGPFYVYADLSGKEVYAPALDSKEKVFPSETAPYIGRTTLTKEVEL